MWVIEIATGKKKNIKVADYVAQWLPNAEKKYETYEKKGV